MELSETESIKSRLSGLLSNMEACNVDMVTDAIEELIDEKIALAVNRIVKRLPLIPPS